MEKWDTLGRAFTVQNGGRQTICFRFPKCSVPYLDQKTYRTQNSKLTTWWRNKAYKTYIYVFCKNVFFLCSLTWVFIPFSERTRRTLSFDTNITFVVGEKNIYDTFKGRWQLANIILRHLFRL